MGDKLGVTGLTIHDEHLWGFYRATVLDNVDPLKLGRIKAEVIPYFVGINKDIIPWAAPKNALIEGAGNGIGTFAVPAIGTMVWVFFEMGNIYQPVYDGEAPDGVNGLPTERTTNYPNRKILKTSSGIVIYIDDTAKILKLDTGTGISFTIDATNDTIDLTHSTGAQISINASGNILIEGADVAVQGSGAVSIIGSPVNINPV